VLVLSEAVLVIVIGIQLVRQTETGGLEFQKKVPSSGFKVTAWGVAVPIVQVAFYPAGIGPKFKR